MKGDPYGAHLRKAAREVRTGPFADMRAQTLLTPTDLRAGAERMRSEAGFRDRLADRLEAEDRESITAHEAHALLKEGLS